MQCSDTVCWSCISVLLSSRMFCIRSGLIYHERFVIIFVEVAATVYKTLNFSERITLL